MPTQRLTAEDESGPHSAARSSIAVTALVVLAAGAMLGGFLARFWYELDPVRFAVFGDSPGAIGLILAAMAFLGAQWWFALRRLLHADAIRSVHIPFALLVVYIVWPEVDLRLAAILLLATAGLALSLGLRAWGALPVSRAASLGMWDGGGEMRALHRLAPAALALLVFAIYVRTLGVHVGAADTFEFQVVAPTLGVAHPTGYPLYILVGKLFSLLPIGSMAFRVNLTSAVFATAATVMAYALLARLSRRRLVAFIAALAFAVSGVLWSQAVEAEVYALNVLIVGMVLALCIDLMSVRAPALPAAGRADDTPYIVGTLFLTLGLGISHHLTAILLLPAFALAVLIARPRLRLRAIAISLGLFALGLAVWLYVPLRWPALHGGTPMTPGQFLDWISGSRFGGALVLNAWSDPARWEIVSRFLLEAFGPAGAGLAVVGLIGLAVRHWRAALITFVAFAAYVFYGLVYLVPDVSVFLIPAYLVLAIWIGAGVATLVDLAARWPGPRLAYPVALTVFVLLPVTLLSGNFASVDRRGAGAQAEAWGRYVLSLPIPQDAALLVDSEKIAPLYYLQVTEDARPDLDILVLGTEQEYRQQLDARLAAGQAVYLARFLPNLPYHMRSLGPLVEVSNEAETATTTGFAPVRFGDAFELVGLAYAAGDPFRVTFNWRAVAASRANYFVRLRLVDRDGRVWWEDSGTHPVGGYYPTGTWSQDEVVSDYHEVAFDPAFPPGDYTLQVGLFPPFRDDGLRTSAGEQWWSAAPLIAPRVTPLPLERALRQTYGGTIGVSSAASIGVLPQDSPGHMRLNWARIQLPAAGLRVSLSVRNAAGQTLWSDVTEPYGGAVSVSEWPPGILQADLSFRTPARDGDYQLWLGFVDASERPLAAKCGWLAAQADACPIAALRVEGEAIGRAINFDDQVLLTGWFIDLRQLRPGETIHVQLDWRSLKKWDADYTVTVQLIGPDGKLHGQVDAWPVQGTLPTSSWAAGQRVTDPYAVSLQPDAPSGLYRIEVGWYLLATLRRLPVVDAAGRPSDDRVVVGEFSVP